MWTVDSVEPPPPTVERAGGPRAVIRLLASPIADTDPQLSTPEIDTETSVQGRLATLTDDPEIELHQWRPTIDSVEAPSSLAGFAFTSISGNLKYSWAASSAHQQFLRPVTAPQGRTLRHRPPHLGPTRLGSASPRPASPGLCLGSAAWVPPEFSRLRSRLSRLTTAGLALAPPQPPSAALALASPRFDR